MLLLRAIWKGFGPYAVLAALAFLAVSGVLWFIQLFGKSTWALGMIFIIVAVPLLILFVVKTLMGGLGGFFTVYAEERQRFREMDARGRRRVRMQTAGLVVALIGSPFVLNAYTVAKNERHAAELRAAEQVEEAEEAKRLERRRAFFADQDGCTKDSIPFAIMSKEENDKYNTIMAKIIRGSLSQHQAQRHIEELGDRMKAEHCSKRKLTGR